MIATVDKNHDDVRLIVFIIEADLSGDPAQYLRAARRIRTAKAHGYEAIEAIEGPPLHQLPVLYIKPA